MCSCCEDSKNVFPYCLKEADKASLNIPSPPSWVKDLGDFGRAKVDRTFAAEVGRIWYGRDKGA